MLLSLFFIESFCLVMLRLMSFSLGEALSAISSSEIIHLSMFSASLGKVVSTSLIPSNTGRGGRSLFKKVMTLAATFKL